MPNTLDYKKIYLILYRAAEKAIRILIDAQQECEEPHLSADAEVVNITKQA